MICSSCAGAERRDDERLRLAAGEQRRAVRARQHADLGDDRADRLGVAAVDAPAVARGWRRARRRFSRSLNIFARERARRSSSARARRSPSPWRVVELVACAPACRLGIGGRRCRAPRSSRLAARAFDGVVVGRRLGRSHGSLAQASASSMIASITGWKLRWPNMTAPSIIVLGQLLAPRTRPSARRRAVPATTRSSCALVHLVERRVQHVLRRRCSRRGRPPIGPMNGMPEIVSAAEAPTRADDVGIVLQVVAQHGADDLRLVAEARREQRADRPVDQARRPASPSRTGGLRA